MSAKQRNRNIKEKTENMSKKPAKPEEIIKIIELILIPSEMDHIASEDKELDKLKQENKENTMFYGYHYGRRQGHLDTIETLRKTANALRGNY